MNRNQFSTIAWVVGIVASIILAIVIFHRIDSALARAIDQRQSSHYGYLPRRRRTRSGARVWCRHCGAWDVVGRDCATAVQERFDYEPQENLYALARAYATGKLGAILNDALEVIQMALRHGYEPHIMFDSVRDALGNQDRLGLHIPHHEIRRQRRAR